MKVLELTSPEETDALGRRLGALLRGGDFVSLTGGLGAGKTHFVRGVAVGAGVAPGEVSSPTYAIVQTYPDGRLPLVHADLYRLEEAGALEATGFYDLDDGRAAFLVEWTDRVPESVPRDALRLSLEAVGATARRLRAEATGARSQALLEAWWEGQENG
ncbi:MAG TPA: tRNA (adenosine(37)-N6)-threonylcarbamoyltransferase complex ATPase subunit type 1 TsaE [Myxococcaceae bacterium]|nr:tRNA (adenosine(37)-N6)-threonylcarbamoyltransferase complex ATPase subunit type 1 TsaE [Myxococcaceae bacterium]